MGINKSEISNEDNDLSINLFSGKKFTLWDNRKKFLYNWSKI